MPRSFISSSLANFVKKEILQDGLQLPSLSAPYLATLPHTAASWQIGDPFWLAALQLAAESHAFLAYVSPVQSPFTSAWLLAHF